MIEITDLSFTCNEKDVIKGISTRFNDGEIIGIIGKSGSGKTLLLKLLSGMIKDFDGEILINKRPLLSFSRRELQKNISFFRNIIPDNSEETLYNFLILSRLPHKKLLNPLSDYDIQVVEETINMFELESYRDSTLASLPDGVLKKAMLAFFFSRKASIFLLDNPTAELDIHSTSLLHKAICRYALDGQNTVILALNDLNFILQTSDRILLLNNGELAMEAHPTSIDVDIIREHFGIEVFLSKNIFNGRPNIHFFPEN